jgi:uncharacterized protein with HEPN domain
MNKRDKTILTKITEEATALAQMIHGIDESAFLANEEKMRAVCMTLINVGELIKNLNGDFRQKHSQIPWKKMAGLRDVAAHGYFTLKMPDVWIYASMELPLYAAQIREILDNEEKA